MSGMILDVGSSNADGLIAGPPPSAGNVPSSIRFMGDGKTLFKIWITNLLLTIVTLGIYFPWGKARIRKYIYSSTYFGDYNFEFHGTGKQMFKGMLKLAAVGLIFILITVGMVIIDVPIMFFLLVVSACFPVILALFMHGGRKYRMSQTSYRGIRFGYRGSRKELIWLMFKGILFSIFTLGIYFPIFINRLHKYRFNHTRYGNVECRFDGTGRELWGIMFFGGFFNAITFGIYNFWYKRNLFNYLYNGIYFEKDERVLVFKAHATAAGFFELLFINGLIIVFTLGFGFPFAKVRTLQFIANNLVPNGDMNLDDIVQTEEQYVGAIGEAADVDFFDFDLW